MLCWNCQVNFFVVWLVCKFPFVSRVWVLVSERHCYGQKPQGKEDKAELPREAILLLLQMHHKISDLSAWVKIECGFFYLIFLFLRKKGKHTKKGRKGRKNAFNWLLPNVYSGKNIDFSFIGCWGVVYIFPTACMLACKSWLLLLSPFLADTKDPALFSCFYAY